MLSLTFSKQNFIWRHIKISTGIVSIVLCFIIFLTSAFCFLFHVCVRIFFYAWKMPSCGGGMGKKPDQKKKFSFLTFLCVCIYVCVNKNDAVRRKKNFFSEQQTSLFSEFMSLGLFCSASFFSFSHRKLFLLQISTYTWTHYKAYHCLPSTSSSSGSWAQKKRKDNGRVIKISFPTHKTFYMCELKKIHW